MVRLVNPIVGVLLESGSQSPVERLEAQACDADDILAHDEIYEVFANDRPPGGMDIRCFTRTEFHMKKRMEQHLSPTRTPKTAIGAEAIGAQAIGAQAIKAQGIGGLAIGALAVGAVAIGTLALGRLFINRLAIRRTRLGIVEIDELRVGRLHVREVVEFDRR